MLETDIIDQREPTDIKIAMVIEFILPNIISTFLSFSSGSVHQFTSQRLTGDILVSYITF